MIVWSSLKELFYCVNNLMVPICMPNYWIPNGKSLKSLLGVRILYPIMRRLACYPLDGFLEKKMILFQKKKGKSLSL